MIKRIQQELQKLKESQTLRELHVRTTRQPGKINIKGKSAIDFTNWDFLNLNCEKRYVHAFQKEAELNGVGSMASRSSSGTMAAHFSLEKRLAEFLGSESALLFSSANQVVLSLVSALLGEGDCVILDERLHGRVVDAAYLVNAEVINFDTADPDTLARAIKNAQPYKNKLIFCESVNPYSGMLLDLKTITDLAEQNQILFILDETYALGTVGLRGAGVMDGVPTPPNLLCRYGSLSYGLGGYGAFLAGPEDLTSYLINRSRTFITECSLPPALSAAIETGLNIIELEHGKRDILKKLSIHLRSSLKLAGFAVEDKAETPILSINFPSKSVATEMADALFQKGFFVEVVNPGFILDTGSAIRIILNSAHRESDLDQFTATLKELYNRVLK